MAEEELSAGELESVEAAAARALNGPWVVDVEMSAYKALALVAAARRETELRRVALEVARLIEAERDIAREAWRVDGFYSRSKVCLLNADPRLTTLADRLRNAAKDGSDG